MEAEREAAGDGSAGLIGKPRRPRAVWIVVMRPLCLGHCVDRGANLLVVPQRQMLVIASSLSASVRIWGLAASSAVAAITMPLWQ